MGGQGGLEYCRGERMTGFYVTSLYPDGCTLFIIKVVVYIIHRQVGNEKKIFFAMFSKFEED